MKNAPSDAFVLFGATGDLAYKKIFPALHNMVRHGTLAVPVIGVAKSGWSIDRLRERACLSIQEHGNGICEKAFAQLMQLLHYVDGDYSDTATFRLLRELLANVASPAHYLAIPSSLFDVVTEGLGVKRNEDLNGGCRLDVNASVHRNSLLDAQKP